jgi:hypothetical protein
VAVEFDSEFFVERVAVEIFSRMPD